MSAPDARCEALDQIEQAAFAAAWEAADWPPDGVPHPDRLASFVATYNAKIAELERAALAPHDSVRDTLEERMTVAEAQAQHDTYFHLWILANQCAEANKEDWPRRNAAWLVRDFCKTAMTKTFADLAAGEAS